MSRETKKQTTISFLGYVGDTQGCGTLRMIIPFLNVNHFRIPGYLFHATFTSVFTSDIHYYRNFTFVIYQRAAQTSHLQQMTHYQKHIKPIIRVPMIYEIDDYLLDVPKWNYAADYYNQHRENCKKMMLMAQAITVSTEFLKKEYKQFNERITVIPNHLSKFLWGEPVPRVKETKRLRIVYPCSQNHFAPPNSPHKGGDIGDTLIKYIIDTRYRHEWVFIGGWPKDLIPYIEKEEIKLLPWNTVMAYPAALKAVNADIGIAPLDRIHFNRAKSNIKLLEYVAAGIPGVYTKLDPYDEAALTAETEDYFIENIEKLLDPQKRLEIWQKDLNAVRHNLFWEENDNILKYINSHLGLFGKELKKQQ